MKIYLHFNLFLQNFNLFLHNCNLCLHNSYLFKIVKSQLCQHACYGSFH